MKKIVSGDVKLDLIIILFLYLIPKVPIEATGIIINFQNLIK